MATGGVGVIAGARILCPETIAALPGGILNLHPGLLPNARGLDALLWSIYDGCRLGVTAHIIDRHVDAGRIVQQVAISEHHNDALVDLAERLYQTQLEMLPGALAEMARHAPNHFPPATTTSPVNSRMPAALRALIPTLLAARPRQARGWPSSIVPASR